MTVLVFGATGNIGTHVVHELTGRGVPVRAFVREVARARDRLGPDIDLAVGDLDDQASIRAALQDVDGVFLSTADVPNKVAQEQAVIHAATAGDVHRLVKLSVNGAAVDSPVPIWRWHAAGEEELRRSGLPATVLRATFFATNLLAMAATIRNTGMIFAPAGEARIAMVDPRDVGAAAAAVLADPEQPAALYTLTGPSAVSFAEVAEVLSAVTGRSIGYVDVPDAAALDGLVQSGVPAPFAEAMVTIFGQLRAGAGSLVSDDVALLTGRQPRPISDFAERHASAFGAAAVVR